MTTNILTQLSVAALLTAYAHDLLPKPGGWVPEDDIRGAYLIKNETGKTWICQGTREEAEILASEVSDCPLIFSERVTAAQSLTYMALRDDITFIDLNGDQI